MYIDAAIFSICTLFFTLAGLAGLADLYQRRRARLDAAIVRRYRR